MRRQVYPVLSLSKDQPEREESMRREDHPSK